MGPEGTSSIQSAAPPVSGPGSARRLLSPQGDTPGPSAAAASSQSGDLGVVRGKQRLMVESLMEAEAREQHLEGLLDRQQVRAPAVCAAGQGWGEPLVRAK